MSLSTSLPRREIHDTIPVANKVLISKTQYRHEFMAIKLDTEKAMTIMEIFFYKYFTYFGFSGT